MEHYHGPCTFAGTPYLDKELPGSKDYKYLDKELPGSKDYKYKP